MSVSHSIQKIFQFHILITLRNNEWAIKFLNEIVNDSNKR